MTVKVTKEADTFYFTYALMKALRFYIEYLRVQGVVHYTVKDELRLIDNRLRAFTRNVTDSLPEEVQQVWDVEWTEKDYLIFSQVFRYMTNMDEDKRMQLEQYAEKLSIDDSRT